VSVRGGCVYCQFERMVPRTKTSVFFLIMVVSVAVSLPTTLQSPGAQPRERRHVSKVKLCGDQLVLLLRIMCHSGRNPFTRNAASQRTGPSEGNTGLGDRCCRSSCTLEELYQAC